MEIWKILPNPKPTGVLETKTARGRTLRNEDDKWAVKKKNGSLGYIGDEKLPSYVGIILKTRCKDLHQTTNIMESTKVFFVALLSDSL